MNLYIIGPVTGIEDDNIQEFGRVQNALRIAGHTSKTPHDFIDPPAEWDYAMRVSIREMLRMRWISTPCVVIPRYDGIAMLDGWENSKGAKIEHDLAEALGIPCKPWREWL